MNRARELVLYRFPLKSRELFLDFLGGRDPRSGGFQTAGIREVGGLESALPWKARSEGLSPKERRFLNRRQYTEGDFTSPFLAKTSPTTAAQCQNVSSGGAGVGDCQSSSSATTRVYCRLPSHPELSLARIVK